MFGEGPSLGDGAHAYTEKVSVLIPGISTEKGFQAADVVKDHRWMRV